MKLINFLDFCAKDDIRSYLNHPFAVGDYTAASNGHVVAFSKAAPGSLGVTKESTAKTLAGILGSIDNAEWTPLPEITIPHKDLCACCGGSGKMFICPECDGDGEVLLENDYSEYECECRTCHGRGKLKDSKRNKPTACDDCCGSGRKYPEKARVKICGVSISPVYAELICHADSVEVSNTEGLLLFRQQVDGEAAISGAIMGIRE